MYSRPNFYISRFDQLQVCACIAGTQDTEYSESDGTCKLILVVNDVCLVFLDSHIHV